MKVESNVGTPDDVISLASLGDAFCAWAQGAVTATRFQVRTPTPEDAAEPRWAATTDYGETFRSILADGPDALPPIPVALTDAARRVSGRAVVVPFRVQANVMLPGQGLGRHTDVPEFRGARRWEFPDWLLVAMLHSGLYDARQIRVVSATTWPCPTTGGALEAFDRPNRARLGSFVPAPGVGVVFDTCRLPHEVARIPGEEVVAGHGDGLAYEDGRWVLRRVDGTTASLAPEDVRISVLVKMACFATVPERDAWAAHEEAPLDQDEVVAALTDLLPPSRRPTGAGSQQALVDHFASYL